MNAKHGNYILCRSEQIIVLEAFGSWNDEASISCINEINFLVNTMQYETFSMVLNTSNLDGVTPESLRLWLDAAKYWYKNGLSQYARVDNKNSIRYKMFSSRFDNMYKRRVAFKFTQSMKEGIYWLNESTYKGFENFESISKEDCVLSDKY